jgi:uncharacterized membrane protein YgdD (TMEM256/DUF423 family)
MAIAGSVAAMERIWIALGALAGLLAVALAAMAAHAPPNVLSPDARAMVERSVSLQGWHATALLAIGVWAPRGGRMAHLAGAALALGLLLFCGAVDWLAFTGTSLGPLAPTGGVMLMLGWLFLGASAFRRRAPPRG